MNIQELTIEQLKVIAFDEQEKAEVATRNVQVVKQELLRRAQEAQAKATSVKDKE